MLYPSRFHSPRSRNALETIFVDLLLSVSFRGLHDEKAMGGLDPNVNPSDQEANAHMKRRFRKVCAKFTNGARVGWGFMLEVRLDNWTITLPRLGGHPIEDLVLI